MDKICRNSIKLILLSMVVLSVKSTSIQFADSTTRISSNGRMLIDAKLLSSPIQGDLNDFMYFYIDLLIGDKMMKQSLIIDTGSSLTAFPCNNSCTNCGKHMNVYYEPISSKSYSKVKCNEKKCKDCAKYPNTCNFIQSYKEGSRYQGFYVQDKVTFGDQISGDGFQMTFGCVTKETNLFYSQRADGILGLSLNHGDKYFPTISQQFKNQGIIDSSQFMLCLGNKGGEMTIGGYNEKLIYDNQTVIQWFPSISNSSYSVQLDKLFVGNVHIPHVPRVGFIDSGASFTFTSHEELEHIKQAFEQFCSADTTKCIGRKVKDLCYEYDITKNTALRTFFESYPTITFTTPSNGILNWFPSEYFYQNNDSPIFCVAIDPINKKNEIVLGAPFMKQNMFIFDPENSQIGFTRATMKIKNKYYFYLILKTVTVQMI